MPSSGPPQPGPPQSGSPQSGSPQSGSPQSGSPQSGSPQSGPPPAGRPGRWSRRGALALAGTAGMALIGVAVGTDPLGLRAAGAAGYTPPTPRRRLDLNGGWRFRLGEASDAQQPGHDDSGWTPLDLPHTWNALDGSDGGNDYRRDVGWYRRRYTVPAGLTGRTFVLQFAGANEVADVWVNGVHQGRHCGGYARFRFDVTAALDPLADNVIAVRVSNRPDPDQLPLRADTRRWAASTATSACGPSTRCASGCSTTPAPASSCASGWSTPTGPRSTRRSRWPTGTPCRAPSCCAPWSPTQPGGWSSTSAPRRRRWPPGSTSSWCSR